MNNPLLTVAICTYNREFFLKKAISSVIDQVTARNTDKVEILIIDNNSSDTTKSTVEKYIKNYRCELNYIFEKKQGLSHARNRAISEAKGLYVAFLDDDGYLCPNWLASVLDECQKKEYDIFGGLYLPSYDDGRRSWFIDEYASNQHIEGVRRVLNQREYLSGGNICFRVSTVFNETKFPTEIGMTGNKVAYGEEIYIQKLARSKCLNIGYIPQMKIMHYTGLNKQSLKWQLLRLYAAGRDVWHTQGIRPNVLNISKMIIKMTLFPFIKILNKKSYKNIRVFIIEVFGPSIACFSSIINFRK